MDSFVKKFCEISKKYNLLEITLIFIVSLFLFFIFYAKQGVYLVDVGRETYIPWQMLEGKLLYKDLYNVYGPLGYQINALIFLIFGIKLNSLYIAGFLNSLVICFVTFYTTKLFTDRKTALCTTFLTLGVCVYIRHLFNFIFSYSYSALYALSGFLLSVFTMLLYIKDKKQKYLILSFLFAGFSITNKIENLPYIIFLFICLPFLLSSSKRKNIKNYLTPLLSFLVFPIVSFGILFIQGVSFSDFIYASELIQKLVKTNAANYYYTVYGLYFNPLYIKFAFVYLLKLLKIALPCGLLFYGLNFLNIKYVQNSFLKKILDISIVFFIFAIIAMTFKQAFDANVIIFCWLGLCALVVAVIFPFFVLYNKKKNPSYETLKDEMFFFLLISTILVSLKGICAIKTESYGTYSLAGLFIPFSVFLSVYLSKIKFLNKEAMQKTVRNLCITASISYLCIYLTGLFTESHYPIISDRGIVITNQIFKSQNQFIKYIKENTPKDSKIVAVPEGSIINFLTNRKSDDFYYYLIPVNVEIFGEDKIVSDFSKNMPDYFIINNVPYTPFHTGDFCQFAPKTCQFIKENYTPVIKTNDAIEFVLYQKKPVLK